MDPKYSKNIPISLNTSNVEEGRFTITATADPNEVIWEQNRTDNTLTAEVEISTVTEFPFILLSLVLLMILIVPIIAATIYSKPRIGPPTWED